MKRLGHIRRGMTVQPRREPFVDGIPLYASPSLQYDDASPAPIGWIDMGQPAYILESIRPRGTYLAVRLLGPEAVGWTSSAYVEEAEA